MRGALAPLAVLLLMGCAEVSTTRDAVLAAAQPIADRGLKGLIAETWDSTAPCRLPASTWVRLVEVDPNAAERFRVKCNSQTLLLENDDE